MSKKVLISPVTEKKERVENEILEKFEAIGVTVENMGGKAKLEESLKEVLLKCSEKVPEDMKLTENLHILQVTSMSKPNADGTPLRTKCWKVQVPNKFREYIMRDEAFPFGWSHRRFFPKRASGPGVPPLNPLHKRPNLGDGQGAQPDN